MYINREREIEMYINREREREIEMYINRQRERERLRCI